MNRCKQEYFAALGHAQRHELGEVFDVAWLRPEVVVGREVFLGGSVGRETVHQVDRDPAISCLGDFTCIVDRHTKERAVVANRHDAFDDPAEARRHAAIQNEDGKLAVLDGLGAEVVQFLPLVVARFGQLVDAVGRRRTELASDQVVGL
jgi:hypothetical protein